MDAVLSSDLILLKILGYLPTKDLFSASFVSKRWKSLARTTLRDQRLVTVKFFGKDICQKLRDFSTLLTSLETAVPYNSIQINPCHLNGPCIDATPSEIQRIHTTILTSMKLKHLKVHWYKELGLPDPNCPIAVELLKKIFQTEYCSSNLEYLDLPQLPELQSFKSCFGIEGAQELKGLLPNLKTFKMTNCRRPEVLELIKEIHVAAPSLQNLICNVKSNMLDYFFSHGKCHTIKKLLLNLAKNESKICFRFAKTQPRLKYFTFSSIPDRQYGPSSYFFHTVTSILESSQDSLEHLYADQLDLTWLGNVDVVLPKLTHLSTRLGPEMTEFVGFNSLSKLNYGKYFPNLTSVQISPEYFRSGLDLYDYVSEDMKKGGSSFTCETVTELKLKYTWDILKGGGLKLIAEVFPHVKHFIFEEMETFFLSCLEALHSHWPGLEIITINGYKIWKHSHSFSTSQGDAAFIGVTEEEVESFKRLEKSSLKKLEIHPQRFSFRKFQNLKKLQINTSHSNRECRLSDDNKFIFSALTGHLVFARMPDLVVEIGRGICIPQDGVLRCGYELLHLTPFVKFVSKAAEST